MKQYVEGMGFNMQIKEMVLDGILIKEIILDATDYSSKELKDTRISVCKTCSDYIADSNQEICKLCACPLETRISFVDMFCPKGLW